MESYANIDVLQQLERALEDLLAGQASLTEGVRSVRRWEYEDHGLDDELFNIVSSVYADTDRFPLGDVRQYWLPASLVAMDDERKGVEEDCRPLVIESAIILLAATRMAMARHPYRKANMS